MNGKCDVQKDKRDYMLELKDMTEKESRDYLNYDANLVYKYKIRIMILNILIKKYGFQEFMEQEKMLLDKEDKVLNIPFDKKREIYRFMMRNQNYSEEQLAKELFRESEYYPR